MNPVTELRLLTILCCLLSFGIGALTVGIAWVLA